MICEPTLRGCRTDEDLQRIGITGLGARRKLMAARRTQTQYKALGDRLEELETLNAQLLGQQAQEVKKVAQATSDSDHFRAAMQALQAELAIERAQSELLHKQVAAQQEELRCASCRPLTASGLA